MHFIMTYGLTIWLAVAAGCMLLGIYLTRRRSRSQARLQDSGTLVIEKPRPSRRKPRALSLPVLPAPPSQRAHMVCPACGQWDHPEARYCGRCGQLLASGASGKKQIRASGWSTDTRLVNITDITRLP
jgi:hypothetical protein